MATLVQKVNSAFNRVGQLLRDLQTQINTNGNSIQTMQNALSNFLTKRNASTTPFQLQDSDNTASGGDNRGEGAVDLQLLRGSNTQVAAGVGSFCAGMANRAGAQSAVSVGWFNLAEGNYSIAFGGYNTASADSSIALGSHNRASGSSSVALGSSNTTSGGSSVALGDSHTASGQYTFCGGLANTASGFVSTSLGCNNTSSGTLSTTFGHFANTNNVARCIVHGFHNSTLGKAQAGRYGTFAVTTNSTLTRTKCDGSSASATNQLALRANSCFKVNGHVVARDTSSNASKSFEFSALVKMGSLASTVSFVGTPTITIIFADSAASSWAVSLVADTASGVLGVNVTGESGKTINWTVSIKTVEVG